MRTESRTALCFKGKGRFCRAETCAEGKRKCVCVVGFVLYAIYVLSPQPFSLKTSRVLVIVKVVTALTD